LVGPKDLPPAIVQSLYDAFEEASKDPTLQQLLDRYVAVPWKKNPSEYKAFAEQYFNSVRPLLIKAGMTKT
jgi:tripartite-type tricarboxylate transporter receptor subunit TctC